MISAYANYFNPIPNSVWSNGNTETMLFSIPNQNGSYFNDNAIPEYVPGGAYADRDYVKHDGKTWMFIQSYSGSQWNASMCVEVLPSGLYIQDYVRRRIYREGEFVRFEGKTYQFLVDYATGQPWSDSYWEEVNLEAINSRIISYSDGVQYHAGDYVHYHGKIYQFNVDYYGGASWDDSYWTRCIPKNWNVMVRDYQIATQQTGMLHYYAGEYVRWEGIIYRFNVDYTSGGSTPWNDSFWTTAIPQEPVVHDYDYRKTYRTGEYVRWKGKIYRFKQDYVEGDEWDDSYWEEVYVLGFSPPAPMFDSNVIYSIGDYIMYEGQTRRFIRSYNKSIDGTFVVDYYCNIVNTVSGDVKPFISAVVNEELGKASSFEFEVDVESIFYDIWRHMRTMVRVEYDGDTIFYGRVLTIDRDMFRTKRIHCEGAYTFFLDSVFEGKKEGYTETVGEYISRLVNMHNTCMNGCPEKQIQLGEVPGNYSEAVTDAQKIKNDTQKFAKQNGYKQIKDWLEELTKDYGGFMRVRYTDGVLYLDWMKNYFNPNENDQILSVSSNVIDLSDTVEVDSIFTHVIPMGKNMKYISGGSGGGGGDGTKYNITVTSSGHGTVSSNYSKAVKGVTVTLTANADNGYVFDKWTVNSGGVTISGNTFRVDGADVSITGSFKVRSGGGGIDPEAQ